MSGPQRLLMAGGGGPSTITITDSFDRADNASVIGNTDTGQAWTIPFGGTWGIISNEAYQSANAGGGGNKAPAILIDSTKSNIDLSVNVTTQQTGNSVGAGLIFRYLDGSNYWLWYFYRGGGGGASWYLQKDGGATTIASGSVTNMVGTLRVVDNGVNSITVYLDGVSKATSSDTYQAGKTTQGIIMFYTSAGGANSGTGWRFNNYSLVGT